MTTTNKKKHTWQIAMSALFLALGVLLPQAFHLALGQGGGKLFLPMQLPVLLAGCFLGWQYGLLIGAVLPPLSFAITGMPSVPLVFLMIAELAFYGLASGVFNKLLRSRERGSLPRIAFAVLLAQLSGRVAYLCVLFLLGSLFGLKGVPAAGVVFTAAATGLPGIAAQWILVPLLVRGLHKMKAGAQQ